MCLEWQHVKTLPIQDASGDLELSKPSSSNWGRRIALNPKTVPMLVEATPETIHAAKYCNRENPLMNSKGLTGLTLKHNE